jgi:hypothetical protein
VFLKACETKLNEHVFPLGDPDETFEDNSIKATVLKIFTLLYISLLSLFLRI